MPPSIDIVGGPKNSRIKISYSGVYDFNKVYRNAINWFKKNGYFFHEKTHIEAVKSTGKEHIINFSGTRDVDDYTRYNIDVEIWTLRTAAVKGEKNLVKGEIQIRIKGVMELDYKNVFGKIGKYGNALRTFYHRYIIRKRIWTKYAPRIYVETNDLIINMKTNLGLITN